MKKKTCDENGLSDDDEENLRRSETLMCVWEQNPVN